MKGASAGLAGLVIAVTAVTAGTAMAGDPSGTWVMANGKVTVRVSECSAKLCARIVGLKTPSTNPVFQKLTSSIPIRPYAIVH